jgi:hypothetical protein
MSQQVSPQYACALLFRSVRLRWSYAVLILHRMTTVFFDRLALCNAWFNSHDPLAFFEFPLHMLI